MHRCLPRRVSRQVRADRYGDAERYSGAAQSMASESANSPITRSGSPPSGLRPLWNRDELLRRHAFRFRLEVHDDAVTEHRHRHRIHIL